jgi:chaperonin GroES
VQDRILVQVAETEGKSSGGVILTAASSEKPTIGKVVAVGPGRKAESGEVEAPTVKAGDQVLYSKYSGTELEEGDVQFVVVRATDVLAVLS